MSKDARRENLLAAALSMVRDGEAHLLTLAAVAAKGGVSKPVAYEHFGTREGLLIALYESLDVQHTEAARLALLECQGSLERTAEALAAAFIDCAIKAGPEGLAIETALAACMQGEDVRHAQQRKYVDLYVEALKPFVAAPPNEARTLMVGLVGAADALGREAGLRLISRGEAIAAVSMMIRRTIGLP
jgi:AcrR family transcriptional regulator